MRTSYFFVLLFTLTACTHQPKSVVKKARPANTVNTDTDDIKQIRYSDNQLEGFLDSVGKLSTQPLADKAAFGADSIFKNQTAFDSVISPEDLQILKRAINKGFIGVKTARRIFHNQDISYECNEKGLSTIYKKGLIPVIYYPFDKDTTQFNEFAICIGDRGHCMGAALYFFKANRLIALHKGYSHYDYDIEHYKDIDGKTIVYYVKEFEDGSGIWWNNFFFYKYDGTKLIPVLDELQNANLLQPSPWGFRALWLESFVVKKNPLTIKMVYDQELPGIKDLPDTTIINDSTLIQYTWNIRTKTLQGRYKDSKISKPQILSYYLQDNELLFINAYCKILKLALLDKTKRKFVLNYLNEIKNHHNKQHK